MQFDLPPETRQANDNQLYNGLAPGYLFAYNFDKTFVNWTSTESGNFNLSTSGDSILTYCLDADGNPHFIHGFTYAEGGWADAGLSAEEYGEAKSALPDELKAQGSKSMKFVDIDVVL